MGDHKAFVNRGNSKWPFARGERASIGILTKWFVGKWLSQKCCWKTIQLLTHRGIGRGRLCYNSSNVFCEQKKRTAPGTKGLPRSGAAVIACEYNGFLSNFLLPHKQTAPVLSRTVAAADSGRTTFLQIDDDNTRRKYSRAEGRSSPTLRKRNCWIELVLAPWLTPPEFEIY